MLDSELITGSSTKVHISKEELAMCKSLSLLICVWHIMLSLLLDELAAPFAVFCKGFHAEKNIYLESI